MPRHQVHARDPRPLIAAVAAAWLGLGACAGPGGPTAGVAPAGGGESASDENVRAERQLRTDPAGAGPTSAPSVVVAEFPAVPALGEDGDPDLALLLPRQPAEDSVVARIGDLEVRRSQVFDRLLESDRRRAEAWIDAITTDIVVAQMAEQFAIQVDAAVVAREVDDEVDLLDTELRLQYGDEADLQAYLQRQYGLTEAEYRETLRREYIRLRYRSLVIRYLALLEDRAEVRYIISSDRAALVDARERVVAGADFAALARRLSEDESRTQGGYQAPFGRSFRHPIAEQAFALQPGEVSQVFTVEGPGDGSGPTRFGLVYCLARLPKQEAPFAEVRDQLVEELEQRPVTAFEQAAFAAQYCSAARGLSAPGSSR
jgi:parvulin-like peptidyl-prolyl isomerase